jgi:hypothetical protein
MQFFNFFKFNFLFGLLELELAALRCFLKKELCPLGVRPWICVFFIYFIFFYSDRLGSNQYAYRFDFLKYDFYYFYGHANFAFVH